MEPDRELVESLRQLHADIDQQVAAARTDTDRLMLDTYRKVIAAIREAMFLEVLDRDRFLPMVAGLVDAIEGAEDAYWETR